MTNIHVCAKMNGKPKIGMCFACKQKRYRDRRQSELDKFTRRQSKNHSLRLRAIKMFEEWIAQEKNQEIIREVCDLLTDNAIYPDPVLVIGILRRRADNPIRVGNYWAKPLRQWMNEKGLIRGKGKS
jgi:hypothetical protein